ncbi:tyrosine-type recombinase/integrase [Janthinobacterium sp. SUN118]|uniref:tyrosine-type recombinase/integrase n=1 Tax=Janthinobacterium sp. SUN118 TaxID=3004100 RepID=UPI0025B0F5B2|nr:tyrosine-type recombinase/integrase [Janthinobacterium sp. SUN118]MDN2710272.1 tyrosine-type recombinase/integrase [Janthinobacterium sp. SUN118]
MPDLPLPKRRAALPKTAPEPLAPAVTAMAPAHGALVDAELAARHQAFLAAATSDNTRRSYRSAIRHFQTWGGALPADESAVIRYLMAYADSLNARTLALRLTALSQWHAYQGFADPASTPTVRKTLAGIARLHGKPKRKAKALPLEDLERIVAQLHALGSVKALRDSALLQLGFFGGFRRSELAGLQLADVGWEPQGMVITLPRSKTDQLGEGIVKAIPFGDGVCCPATALRAWLAAAHIRTGPLLRPVNQWGHVSAQGLHAGSINTILDGCAKLAGLDYVPELSSHSLRRGMATSAHRAGADFQSIKRQGGWRHDGTVHGYIEEAGRFEDNAAGSLLKAKKKPAA